jgi:hypothetical protein
MSKPKGGLQKKVSSIFSGVPLESEATHGEVRHATVPTDRVAVSEASLSTVDQLPVAPSLTGKETAVAEPAATVSVSPAVTTGPSQPESTRPKQEQRQGPSLAAVLAAGTMPSPSRGPSIKLEAPRVSQPAPERPQASPKVAPRVIVKTSSQQKDQKKTMIAVGVLAVIFVLVVMRSSGFFSKGSQPPTPAPATKTQTSQTVPTPTAIVWQRPLAPPDRSLNPMKSGSIVSPSTSTHGSLLCVTGIFWTPSSATAVVDGQRVKVGDSVRDMRITRISRDCIEYEVGTGTETSCVQTHTHNQTGSTDVKPDANSRTIN